MIGTNIESPSPTGAIILSATASCTMEDNVSYVDAVDKRAAMFIPIDQWRHDTMKSDDFKAECDKYCDRLHSAEWEVDELRCAVHDLEEQLKAAKASTYAATASRATSKPLAQTPACTQ